MLKGAEFGEGSGPIFLEGINCIGNEDSLLNCSQDTPIGLSACDHSSDVGVRCKGI